MLKEKKIDGERGEKDGKQSPGVFRNLGALHRVYVGEFWFYGDKPLVNLGVMF